MKEDTAQTDFVEVRCGQNGVRFENLQRLYIRHDMTISVSVKRINLWISENSVAIDIIKNRIQKDIQCRAILWMTVCICVL